MAAAGTRDPGKRLDGQRLCRVGSYGVLNAVHRVQDAITSDPTKPLTIKSLARIAGSSSRHLSRLFKEHAGISLIAYRNRLRVALSRELLGNTQLDIERVAERSGFASARQLRRVWRRVHPTAPKAARV